MAEAVYTPFRTEPGAAPVRLIVRRVRPTPGSQLALFANYSYHAFITDRQGDTLELEADHRRHAEIENAIRDLKYGMGLNHLPSGRFPANGAWLAVQIMAHNLARWTAPSRPEPADRDHQDPPTSLLLPGGTHHPQGPWPHFASPPAVALGNPVHVCTGPFAGHSTAGLTPPDATDSPTNNRGSPSTRANQASEGLLLTAALHPPFPKTTPGHHWPCLPANIPLIGHTIPVTSQTRAPISTFRWIRG